MSNLITRQNLLISEATNNPLRSKIIEIIKDHGGTITYYDLNERLTECGYRIDPSQLKNNITVLVRADIMTYEYSTLTII